MRLRFPELKNAANKLKKLLDDEFLLEKWGETDKKESLTPVESKHEKPHPAMQIILRERAFSPFLENYYESKTNPDKKTLRLFLKEVMNNPSLKKKLI